MKELLTILLLWFLFETDEEVIEPLQALAADLTALELEVECGLPRRLTAHRSNEFQNILDHVTDLYIESEISGADINLTIGERLTIYTLLHTGNDFIFCVWSG